MGQTLEIDAGAKRLDQLYRRFSRRVRWVARARGVPEAALDDVVHDAFLRIFRKYSERDRTIPLASWVDGIARNVAFTQRRSHARRVLRDAAAPQPDPVEGPDEALARKDAWRALQAFLDELDPDQREAFILCDVLKTPAPDVARATGVKLNTVYSRVRLARRRFAQSFGPEPDAVREAMKQERRGAAHSRRAMALLLTDLGISGTVTAAATASTGFSAIAALTTIAAVGGAVALFAATPSTPTDEPTEPQHTEPTRTESTLPASPVASAATPTTAPSPAPARPAPTVPARAAPRPRHAATPPANATPPAPASVELQKPDPLAAEVALLSEARTHLSRGRPAKALRLVDQHRDRFPTGSLEAQRHGIERDAACAMGDEARARRAARALGADRSGPVCTTPRKTDEP